MIKNDKTVRKSRLERSDNMEYTFFIFKAKSMHEVSNSDEHISTMRTTMFNVAKIVDEYNKNNNGYFYFIRM